MDFAHQMSSLSKFNFGDQSPAKVKMSSIPALVKVKKLFSLDVLIPTESALAGTLPLNQRADKKWNPFGEVQPAKLHSVLDEVEVLRSLQAPKVVTFLGTNGVQYRFLAKPRDDLRKVSVKWCEFVNGNLTPTWLQDSRVMEVNSLVNKLLSRDPDSRRRQLRIQTYGVTPMCEETGLIEWVSNLQGE
jgi:serine/threonine-protein kinase ATR